MTDTAISIQQALVNLMEEVPGDTIVVRYITAGPITAARMVREIETGSDIGRKYGSDVLRVARDLLIRQTERGKVSDATQTHEG